MGFLMIPVSTLYDEYIDLSKLSEQKKTQLSGSKQKKIENVQNAVFIRTKGTLDRNIS